jgi:PAS domain S-box-containing protein
VFTLLEGEGLDALGLKPEKVLGRSIFEMHRDAPRIVWDVRLALAGKVFDTTVEIGGLVFETRYASLRENDEFSGVLGVATDVTERKQTEDRLRAAETRYRTLVEQVPAITYIEELTAKGKRLTYISPQYEATLGYSPKSGLSYPEHWLEIVHPDDLERLVAEDARTDETLEPFRMEYRMFAKDGRVVWIRDEAVVVRDEGGRPSFWQGVMFDVTEQKRAEEDLREAEARYRTLVEQIPAGVYIQRLEYEGAIDYISPRIEDMLGYSPREYVEDPGLWVETTHPEDRERVLAEDTRTDETGEPFTVEFRKITRDGRIRWIRDEAVLVKDAEGKPLYWQGIFVDITERRKFEEELEESRRRLSALLSNVSAYLYRCRNEPEWPNEFVSDYAFELTGHTPEELTDGSVMFADLIVEEDRDRVWEEVQAGLAEHGRFELQYSLRRKDGEVRHVEERGQGIYGEGGGGDRGRRLRRHRARAGGETPAGDRGEIP